MEGLFEAIQRADSAVALWLNGWVGRFPAVDALVEVLVSDYLVPVLFSLVLVVLWFGGRTAEERERWQRTALHAAGALALANLAVSVANLFIFRPRPFAEHEVALLFYPPTDSSFPANPAAFAFAVAAAVARGHRGLGAVMYALATAYSLSRVYAGVFYPTDVVAGALIGLGTAAVAAFLARRLEPLPTWVLRRLRLLCLA